MLQRDNNGVERAISFCSKNLSPPQRNYSTFERECLAIICALEHFRIHRLSRKFRLRADHCVLAWLFSKKPKVSARISGWLAALMEYPIAIDYVRKSEYRIADALAPRFSYCRQGKTHWFRERCLVTCHATKVDRL